jgi:hypothetical protein
MFWRRARRAKKQPTGEIPPLPKECRAWVRHPLVVSGLCEPVPARSADQAELKWQAQVRDVSANGLSLWLLRRYEPGAALFLELEGADGVRRSIGVTARNVRPDASAGWVVGCQFVRPLSDDEMRALLEWARAGAA